MTIVEAIAGFVRRATIWDLVLRLLVVSAPLAVLGLAAALAPTGVPGLLVILVGVGAVVAAALPGSHAAGIELALLAWVWLAAVEVGTNAWTLAAALCLLLFHTSSLLAAAAPLGGHPERRFLAAVGRRVGIVAAVVVAVWAVVALLDSGSRSGNAAVYSAALGAMGVLGVGLVLAGRTDGSTPDH